MGVGQGSISVQQKISTAIPSGPPFALNSADNGLSVDPVSKHIVLGQAIGAAGDPAQLLSSREIPLAGFNFSLGTLGTGGRRVFLDEGNDVFAFGDVDLTGRGGQLYIDDSLAGHRWGIGELGTLTNLLINFPFAGIGLSFFDSNGTNPFLLPDPAFGGIAFMSSPDFLTQLALADSASGGVAQLGDTGAISTGMEMNLSVPAQKLTLNSTAFGIGVVFDLNSGDFFLGDWNNTNNGTFLDVYDNSLGINPYILMQVGNPPLLHAQLDSSTRSIVMGDGSINFITYDFTNGLYRTGNAAVGSGNFFELDDVAGQLTIDNIAHNMSVRINGANGFTGTVTPVTAITVVGGIVTNVV